MGKQGAFPGIKTAVLIRSCDSKLFLKNPSNMDWGKKTAVGHLRCGFYRLKEHVELL